MTSRNQAKSPPTRSIATISRVAAFGLLTGLSTSCVVSMYDSKEACWEDYGDCMEDADDSDEFEACEQGRDACLEACDDDDDDDDDSHSGDGDGDDDDDDVTGDGDGEGDDDDDEDEGNCDGDCDSGDGDGDSGEGEGDGDGDSTGDGDGDGDGDSGEGDGDGDSGEGDGDGDSTGDGDGDVPDACVEIFATCVSAAETIEDIEACEQLFDNCVEPGPCDPPLPDDDLVEECLNEYDLCTECAGPEQLDACKSAFDNCLDG